MGSSSSKPKLDNPTSEEIHNNIKAWFINNNKTLPESTDFDTPFEHYKLHGGNCYDRKRYQNYNEVKNYDKSGGNLDDSLAELNEFHKTLLSRHDVDLSATEPATDNVADFFGMKKNNQFNVTGGSKKRTHKDSTSDSDKHIMRFQPANDDDNDDTSKISDSDNSSNMKFFVSDSNKKKKKVNSSESSYITTLPFYSTESSYYSFQHPYVANRFDN